MEQLTKKDFKTILTNNIDTMFAAEDWDTFNSRLQNIAEQLLALEYIEVFAESSKRTINSRADFLRKTLAFKYIDGKDMQLKRSTIQIKKKFCDLVNFSNLPGPVTD